MQIERLDHFVLTVQDMDATISFYQTVLGMEPVTFGSGRRALVFGQSKINLHPANAPLVPHANHPVPGSADLCFVTAEAPHSVIDHLRKCGINVEEGPVPRTGALGPITSVYFRDPDSNLIEVSSYET
ncbi:MAG: VOC family protein [Candidatus Contendobacter sp.]|nr:MAG: VOC family protein [Candidatus Contendobacter sp.]